MTKLNNLNCDKTQKLKLWQNLKTQIPTKLKNSNWEKNPKLKLWPNSKDSNCDKTQIATKLKNSNRDKTQKLKLQKKINWNCDKTLKLKLSQNSKTLRWSAWTQMCHQSSQTQWRCHTWHHALISCAFGGTTVLCNHLVPPPKPLTCVCTLILFQSHC